ncbi:MAG: GAF domain-containing protein [candidate division Zixibacteria bacterium]|nr:GAF domain-containing protein [candidate division Zixibacteria bacterium]
MYELTLDLAVVFFLFCFLILIVTQKRRYFLYHPQSWRTLTLGGILLAVAGGIKLWFILYEGKYAFSPRWEQAFQVGQISVYLAGGGLILFGFLRWCGSLVEGKNKATQRLRQLACLRSILLLADHRTELDEILKEALRVVMNIRKYEVGLVFKRAFNSSEMTLVAHRGVPAESLFGLFDLCSKNMWYRESLKSQEIATTIDVENLPEYETLFRNSEEVRSLACVPIKFRGKVMGLFGIYDSKPDRFSYEEIQFLTSLGEALGLAARQIYTCKRNKKRRDYISAIENILKINEETATLEHAFPKISTELRRIIDFDHISLDLMTGGGQDVQRISIGTSGGILVDKKAVMSSAGISRGTAMMPVEVRIDHDLELDEDCLKDPLVKACGIRSRILLPLGDGYDFYGVLCLGHRKPNFYSATDAKWLGLFVLELSHLIREQRVETKSKKKESLSNSLYESEKKLAVEQDLKTLLQHAAASLTSDLPKSFARVVLLSRERNELINCAASQIRSEGINLKREQRFSLNDLPWHRLTLEARKPMLINQDDPEGAMSKQEARLIMDEKVNSALLVPLILHDRAVGILSVGEMRNWNRQPLTQDEIAFVKHKANQLCLALEKGVLHRSNERLKERLKHCETPKKTTENQARLESWLSDLSYQISNPLTIIRGAAELLKLTETDLGPDSLRYIRNIENGVDRIQENLEEFLGAATGRRKPDSAEHADKLVSV